MWEAIREDAASIETRRLRDLGVYGGGAGIWVNKQVTSGIAPNKYGVAVGFLHTGRHYPDDVGEKEMLYHYPQTDRGVGHDETEIEGAKNACLQHLPIFVILPGKGSQKEVRLGWITDWEDKDKTFLVSFSEDQPKQLPPPEIYDEQPFFATGGPRGPLIEWPTRPGQPRFRLEVLRRYGESCAVCPIQVPELLEAAHLYPAALDGTYDPRNGLVLCANHHAAFDSPLFGIEPESLQLHYAEGQETPQDLEVTRPDITHLARRPHPEALMWKWKQWES